MAGERDDLSAKKMRSYIGPFFYIAMEHEQAGIKSPDYWEGFKAALMLMEGYIMGDLDEMQGDEIPKPGTVARMVKRRERRKPKSGDA